MVFNDYSDYTTEELVTKIKEAYTDAERKVGKCNVLIIGKTGVGKSTLVNSIFQKQLARTGVGRPVTKDITQFSQPECPITIYDSPGLEIFEEKNRKIKEQVSELIRCKKEQRIENHIHVIWYCINGGSNRIESNEESWIRELSLEDVSMILVVTQVLNPDENEFLKHLKSLNLSAKHVIPVLAEKKRINKHYTVPAYGLDELVEETAELLPDVARKAFIREQIASIDLKAKEAESSISGFGTASGFLSLNPAFPISVTTVILTQVAMLAYITYIFGLPFNEDFFRTIIATLGGTGALTVTANSVAKNLLKMIPGVGGILSGAISVAAPSILTRALGLAYIESLMVYMKAHLDGQNMPQSELSKLIIEGYKYYASSEAQKLRSI